MINALADAVVLVLHQIAHWLGWNVGRVVFTQVDDRVAVAFRCDGCGRVSGQHWSCSGAEPLPSWAGTDIPMGQVSDLSFTDAAGYVTGAYRG